MMSAASRPHHWTGSIYSRFSVVTSSLARQIYSFLVAGECLCGDNDKKGNLHIVHAPCWPLSCWQHRSVVISAAKLLQSFPPALTDHYWPGHCIMVTLWRGRPMLTTGDDDTSVTCHEWSLPRDAISSHSHHIPHTSTGQVSPRNIRQQFLRPLLSDRAGNYKMLSIFWHSQLRLLFLHLQSRSR